VISGPSGTGKGAICAGLVANQKVAVSVSMTTRQPRGHEVEGKSYYFVNKERFLEIQNEDGFIEHAEIYGEYYGTPKGPVEEQLDKGVDVILEIDVNGAMQVKETMPNAVFIFIMPPSPEELRRRIEKRGTETAERIACRLARSDSEIARLGEYDYCVINDKLDEAISDTEAIIKAERLKVGSGWEKIIERYNKEKEN